MKPTIKKHWFIGIALIFLIFFTRTALISLLSSPTSLPFFSSPDLSSRSNIREWVGEEGGGGGDAVVTFVFSDSYVPPSLVLVKSMENVAFRGDKVCLVTHKVSKRGVDKLRSGGWKVLNIPLIENPLIDVNEHEFPSEEEKQKGIATWTKLHLFSLTEYSRILYIDSDAFFYTQPASFSKLFDCLNKEKNIYTNGDFTEKETVGERLVCGVHQKKTETLPNSMTLNTGFLVFRPLDHLRQNMLERAKDLGGGEDDFTEQNFLQNYFYLLCSAASSSSFSHSSSTSFLTDLSLSLSRTTIPSSSTSFLSLPLYDPESKKVNKTTERQWEGMEEKEKTKIEKEERKVIAEKKEGRTEVEGGGEEGRVVYSSSCAFLPDKWNHAQSFIFLGEGGGKEKGEEKEKEKEGDKEGEGEEMGGEGEVEEVEGKGDGPPFLVHFSGGLSKPWIWRNYFFGKYFEAWRRTDNKVLKESHLPGIEDTDFWLGVEMMLMSLVVLVVLFLDSLDATPSSANVLPAGNVFAQRKQQQGSLFLSYTFLFFILLFEIGVWTFFYRNLPSLMGFILGWMVYFCVCTAFVHFSLFVLSFLRPLLPRPLPIIKPPTSRSATGYMLSLLCHCLFVFLLTQISGMIGPFKGNPYLYLKVLDLVMCGGVMFVFCILPSYWWFHQLMEKS